MTGKVSAKLMSANADNVRSKLACTIHVWAYFEKLAVSGKAYFTKIAQSLGQDISCIKFLQ